jgi:site-specific DNA-methyltransferase (adenine-specific)
VREYWSDGKITLYCGRMEDVLPQLDLSTVDAVIADPPYGETSLAWDRWTQGWPSLIPVSINRMWCFGSLDMFMDHAAEFAVWRARPRRQTRSIVWEKHNGSGFAADFFKGVHELAGYFYQGPWAQAHEDVPRVSYSGPLKTVLSRGDDRTPHTGSIGTSGYTDDGFRLVRSVLKVQSMHGRAIHPTEKPINLLAPMLEYSVPAGGTVLDLFAGSCSTSLTARNLGRKSIAVEADEAMCEKAVRLRLDVPDLFTGGAA